MGFLHSKQVPDLRSAFLFDFLILLPPLPISRESGDRKVNENRGVSGFGLSPAEASLPQVSPNPQNFVNEEVKFPKKKTHHHKMLPARGRKNHLKQTWRIFLSLDSLRSGSIPASYLVGPSWGKILRNMEENTRIAE